MEEMDSASESEAAIVELLPSAGKVVGNVNSFEFGFGVKEPLKLVTGEDLEAGRSGQLSKALVDCKMGLVGEMVIWRREGS